MSKDKFYPKARVSESDLNVINLIKTLETGKHSTGDLMRRGMRKYCLHLLDGIEPGDQRKLLEKHKLTIKYLYEGK